jgi:hypothetical protein
LCLKAEHSYLHTSSVNQLNRPGVGQTAQMALLTVNLLAFGPRIGVQLSGHLGQI